MKKDSPNFDIFLSYTENDKSWAKSLFQELTKQGYKVFFGREHINLSRDDTWKKTYTALSDAKYIIFIVSKNGLSTNWEQMEIIAQIWFGLLKKNKKSLIISLSDLKIPALIKQSKLIDGQDEPEIDDIVEEISFVVKPGKASRKTNKQLTIEEQKKDILKSLEMKLKFSFFIANPAREKIDPLYEQFPYNEHLQLLESKSISKSDYFLSYWGYKSAKLLAPELFDNFSKTNAGMIHSSFSKQMLLEVPLLKSGYRTVFSIKHTLWAVEILLLLESNLDFVEELIENLVERSGEYSNSDGGWKDFFHPERQSSLLTTLYAFCLFSKISQHNQLIDIPKRLSGSVKEIIQKTESYILSQWDSKKWEFSNLHWQISSVLILISYLPYSGKTDYLKKIIKILDTFLDEKAELINPYIGTEYFLSEYILSLRLAYVLKISSKLTRKNKKYKLLQKRLIENYQHSEFMNNCDIFFLAEILQDTD